MYIRFRQGGTQFLVQLYVLAHGQVCQQRLVRCAIGNVHGYLHGVQRLCSGAPGHGAFTGAVKTAHQPEQTGLPASVGAQNGEGVARLKGQAHFAQDPYPTVAFPHPIYCDTKGGAGHQNGPRTMPLSEARMKSRMVSLASLTGNSSSATFRACDMLPPVTYRVR